MAENPVEYILYHFDVATGMIAMAEVSSVDEIQPGKNPMLTGEC